MKRLRILALMHPQLVPPDSLEGHTEEEEINVWKTEYDDVVSHLRAIGHEVRVLGVQYELLPIRDAVEAGSHGVQLLGEPTARCCSTRTS